MNMQLERRALYTSLRLNWLIDPQLKVDGWQVEDYRTLTIDELFNRLTKYQIQMNRALFTAFVDECDTPEELADKLTAEIDSNVPAQDEVYLIVFELWRRLVPEKQSLSVFCDEMDHQIYLHDTGQVQTAEGIEDAFANLKMILDENVDNGADPVEALETISSGCAHDLEGFLYDFISTQIDDHNLSYASELIDAFADYVDDVRGFDFLRTRVLADSDPEAAAILLRQLMEEVEEEADFGFNLEILSFLAKEGDKSHFLKMLKLSIPAMQTEADFQDILQVCSQYFHFLDEDDKEQAVQQLLQQRPISQLNREFKPSDPILQELLKLF